MVKLTFQTGTQPQLLGSSSSYDVIMLQQTANSANATNANADEDAI